VSVARDSENELLVRLARALAPASDDFVVIGGAAHQLFRLVDLAQPVDFPVVRTFDADVAIRAGGALASMRLDERLADLGFRAEPSGGATPPATRYVMSSAPAHYLQFVTHRTGSGTKRSGRRESTAIVAGTVAERLSHIDLLLNSPWTVELDEAHGYPATNQRLELRIANAAAYIAQKLLVLSKRDPRDRAKDVVYVHDTLLIFAAALDDLAQLWRRSVRQDSKTARDVAALAAALSSRPTDDIRRAVQLLRALDRSNPPDEKGLLLVLRAGLGALFPVR
jgi:hypothetical protein